MSDRKKVIDPLPEEFATSEEAAEFWDTHDTTDYPHAFRTVAIEAAELRQRHYEVEIEADLLPILSEQAQTSDQTISDLVGSILRQHFLPATS